MMDSNHPIVFFDGVCGLCNRSIDFLVRVDRARKLRFAPLQGRTAAKLLPVEAIGPDKFESIVFLENGRVYTHSDAILRIGMSLGGIWSYSGLAVLIPRPLRDSLYRWIARNRYRWFGKRRTCRLPSQGERALFFD